MDKPILSNDAFWGVNMDEIDYNVDILNILERVIYKGSIDDFIAIREFYGDKNIRKEIINSKCFGPKEVNFCCLIFKLKTTDFIHYKEGQFKSYPEFKNCPDDFIYPDFACS
jgi:hypothetical protein